MKSCEIVKAAMEQEGVNPPELSKRLGKSDTYIYVLLSRPRELLAGNLARILDALDYDLLARSRVDGAEFFVSPKD